MDKDYHKNLSLSVDSIVHDEVNKLTKVLSSVATHSKKQKINVSNHFIAGLTKMVDDYAKILVRDLELFAQHGKRQTITSADVLLASRKSDELSKHMTQFVSNLESGKKKKKPALVEEAEQEEEDDENDQEIVIKKRKRIENDDDKTSPSKSVTLDLTREADSDFDSD